MTGVAGKAGDPRRRRFYEALLAPELEHYMIIENVLAYLKHPGEWFMAEESERWNWMNT